MTIIRKLRLLFFNNFLLYIGICTFFLFTLNLIIANLLLYFYPYTNYDVDWLEKYSVLVQIVLVVLLAPLFETFIFQYLIISPIFFFKFKGRKIVASILSSIAFASSHYYSWQYVLIMFILGLFMAFFFIDTKERFRKGFIAVFLIHAGMNALSYIEF